MIIDIWTFWTYVRRTVKYGQLSLSAAAPFAGRTGIGEACCGVAGSDRAVVPNVRGSRRVAISKHDASARVHLVQVLPVAEVTQIDGVGAGHHGRRDGEKWCWQGEGLTSELWLFLPKK